MSDTSRFTWLQPRALAEEDNDYDDRLLLLDGDSQPTSSPHLSKCPWPPLQPRMSPDDSSNDAGVFWTYERAAGVDAIAHKLSIQHLRPDYQPPSSSSQAATPASMTPPSVAESRPRVASSTSPAVTPSEQPRGEHSVSPRHQASAIREDDRLRRVNSYKFYNTIQSTQAIQKLVEDKICTTIKCNVLDLPMSASADAYHGTEMEVDPTSTQAADDLRDDAQFGKSLIEQLTEARHGSGILAMRRAGLPLYRSSTETALRCQNLVRNKPRMRKRTKLRDRPKQPAISAAAGLSVASKSSTPC